MSYQSLAFIVFSAITVLLYYIVGTKRQAWVLAIANLTFYAIAGIEYLPFILVTMIATFVVGKRIGSIYEKCDGEIAKCTEASEKKVLRAKAKTKAKRTLQVGLVITIAILAVCKYTAFTLQNINAILVAFEVPQITVFKMILPLGISFYSFMALSYILDIYWKRYKAESNFLYYAVYLSYFPHVVQGPIDRFNEFKEQIKDGVKFNTENLTRGTQLALWGLFKKLVIADRLGIFVDSIFENWKNCGGITLMIAVAVYSIQIYTDFSGCIDIVSGVSECFGIKLRKNFNHPYFSKTMGEFWRRWHISLQEWFKDYVYYPVSASSLLRKAKKHFKEKNQHRAMELVASCFPVLVVWLITGIWHGAAWKFVAWGLFHAALLISSQIFEPTSQKITAKLKLNSDNATWRFIQMARTFTLCCIGRVFFRASGLKVSLAIFERMFTVFTTEGLSENGLDLLNLVFAIVSVLFLLGVDMLQEKTSIRDLVAKQNIVLRWTLVFIGLFAIILFGIYGPGYDVSSFIYEQF